MKLSVINIDPKILGGTPVFRGTRVPIQALFDHLPYPCVDEFLDGFDHISIEMVEEVLKIAAKKVIGESNNPIDKMSSEEYIVHLKNHFPPDQILFI
jgi:uncharacterized protein (DUF433 family)